MTAPRSIADVTEEIMLRTKKPMHYKVITPLLLKHCKLLGKTPEQSVRSSLATNPKFKRVAEGTFALTIWKKYPAIRFAKDIAYDILKSGGYPLKITLLGEKILNERKFSGTAKTVAKGVVNTDNRFYYDRANELVGLIEWRRHE
ncbi:MAG: winged helix-turn-helix domain-containing protein [Anaerolineales bacterium]